jgi:hypothetical protein
VLQPRRQYFSSCCSSEALRTFSPHPPIFILPWVQFLQVCTALFLTSLSGPVFSVWLNYVDTKRALN